MVYWQGWSEEVPGGHCRAIGLEGLHVELDWCRSTTADALAPLLEKEFRQYALIDLRVPLHGCPDLRCLLP